MNPTSAIAAATGVVDTSCREHGYGSCYSNALFDENRAVAGFVVNIIGTIKSKTFLVKY